MDAYNLPEGALAPCGVTYYPLLRTSALPDGGTAYVYSSPGGLTTYYVPRAGFNPYLASSAVRSAYDIPPEPANGPGRQRWITLSQHAGYVTPGPFIVSAPAAPELSIKKGSWGGYNTYSTHNRYTKVGAMWTEPHFLPSKCDNGASAFWVGLGGVGKNEPLAQDGTIFGLPNFALHQAFYEILPAKPMPEPLRATVGKGFTAETDHVRSTKTATEYRFIMDNLSLVNGTLNFTKTVNGGWSGKHADVIAEWPFTSGLDLANFGTIHFDSASANDKKLGSFPHVENEIADSHVLAVTSALHAQSNFTVTEHHCI